MRKIHYYAVDTTVLSPRRCWTCGDPTTYRCLNCAMSMCLGCKGRHPKATYVGRPEDAPDYIRTYPTRFSRRTLALLVGYWLLFVLLIAAVVVIFQKL